MTPLSRETAPLPRWVRERVEDAIASLEAARAIDRAERTPLSRAALQAAITEMESAHCQLGEFTTTRAEREAKP